MRKDNRMSLDEHLETADDLAIVAHHLSSIFRRCQEHYGTSSKLIKRLAKICPGHITENSNSFSLLRSELDKEFNKTVDDEDFIVNKQIYSSLEARYKKIAQKQSEVV